MRELGAWDKKAAGLTRFVVLQRDAWDQGAAIIGALAAHRRLKPD